MNRLITKLTSYLVLAALVLPTALLAMPQGAQAAVSVVSGGSTADKVNGTQTPFSLSNLVINSDLVGDFEGINGIVVDIESTVAGAGLIFSGVPTAIPTGAVTIGSPVVDPSHTRITIGVTVPSILNDTVKIQGLNVVANSINAFEGKSRLRITTGNPEKSAYSAWFDVDAKNPVLNITGPVNDSLVNKLPVIGYTVESGATIAVTFNRKNLGFVKSGTVLTGAVQGENKLAVTATDLAGNKVTEYRSFKYDSAAPGYTVGTNPDGATVASDSMVVFEGTAEQSANVKLIVKDENTDLIVKESGPFTRTNDSWRFEIAASDVGAGWHDAYVEITDSAGNITLQKIAHFGVASPVVKAAYRATTTYGAAGTVAGTTPRGAVTPGKTSEKVKEELKDDVEDTAEGIIKAAEAQEEQGTNPWQTVVTVIAILIIAIGVGTAGYYGYEWWATRGAVAVGTSGPGEEWDKPEPTKKTVRKTVAKKKTTAKKTGRRSSSRW